MRAIFLFISFLIIAIPVSQAQEVPSALENIDYLVTFSKGANPTWGDDDHVQIYFFTIPTTIKAPFYIRVFDPEISGSNDMLNEAYNSSTRFSVYGGVGAYTNKEARGVNSTGNFKSGNQLASKTFTQDDAKLDNTWYTFGPFNPQDGEFDKTMNAAVFKIVVEGLDGDDGNMYRFFLSSDKTTNKAIEGGNAFAYEISFRLKSQVGDVGHLFPRMENTTTSVKLNNFDFDKDGYIRITSINKKCHDMKPSADGNWEISKEEISKDERNTSLDIQFIKKLDILNDMTFNITDETNQALPMYSYPAGGIPKYKFKVDVVYETDK